MLKFETSALRRLADCKLLFKENTVGILIRTVSTPVSRESWTWRMIDVTVSSAISLPGWSACSSLPSMMETALSLPVRGIETGIIHRKTWSLSPIARPTWGSVLTFFERCVTLKLAVNTDKTRDIFARASRHRLRTSVNISTRVKGSSARRSTTAQPHLSACSADTYRTSRRTQWATWICCAGEHWKLYIIE